ncbi:MAG: outer membrane protein OmpW [Gammaproteobacteria bacterium]|nr:MAG: outer membrane protein OmpW [Gammaproteobacteria bacterium]
MSTLKRAALIAAMATTFTTAPTMAYEAGDMVLRVGAAGVLPTGESDSLNAVPGGKVEAADAWSLGLTFTYMLTDQFGLGILAAYPFSHDLESNSTLANALGDSSDIGETKQLPPTVTLQWHFPIGSPNFQPYVGAGLNYTYFFDEDTKGPLNGVNLDIDNSWGLAAEAGLDYVMDSDWTLSAQVWYISIEPEAKIQGGGLNEKIDVEIDPWVFMASVGKKF